MAYTTIDNSEEAFQTFSYTGDGSTSAGKTRTFDGSVDLKPGLMYQFKFTASGNRGNIMDNEFQGAGWHWLAFASGDAKQDGITASYNTNGFTHATQNLGGYYHNENSSQYGIWAWKESGVSNANNTDGTISSVVRVNSDIGLSFVNWTGTSENGTIGHGLGKKPDALWMYPIQVAANNGNTQRVQWWKGNSLDYVMNCGLNENDQESNSTNGILSADATGNRGTTSVFTVKEANSSFEAVNHSSQNYLCLAWVSIQGFSKFSIYEGNGNNNGTFVYTGFKPALVIIKCATDNKDFRVFDNRRDPTNLTTGLQSVNITANYGIIRDDNTRIDILSNGFRIRCTHGSLNGSGETYCYGAFAENPFVTSTGVPTTAR